MTGMSALTVGSTVIVSRKRWTVTNIRGQGSTQPFQTNTRVTLARAGASADVLVPHAVVTRERLLAAADR
ncbi:hypothetical protein SEA_STLSCUM_98 [Mycobacterium phage STLscum]|nr:hypothetical protein SEA_STLSCUM_98 [Mycobacterium phage STLscum]